MSFLKYQIYNPEFLNNYLKYSRFIVHNAETSVNEMYFDIRTFFRYLVIIKENADLLDTLTLDEFKKIKIKDITLEDLNKVTHYTVIDFIFFVRNFLKNCNKTSNRKIASLKKFFEYLEIHNMIRCNPLKFVDRAKVEKRLPKVLNLNDSKMLLSKMINSNQKNKIRNYTITCILLNCCIRVSELININLTDIKLDEKTIIIREGKGKKDRVVYINEAVYEAIEAYLQIRPNLPKNNKDYNALFLSSQNKRISKRSVQNIITSSSDIHVHTLRHTGATLMYNINNTNIFVLKKILGHDSLKATEIYTHVSPEKLHQFMMNYNIFDK